MKGVPSILLINMTFQSTRTDRGVVCKGIEDYFVIHARVVVRVHWESLVRGPMRIKKDNKIKYK